MSGGEAQWAAPSAFWLGRLIHLVHDSYSPSHTLRVAMLPPSVSAPRMLTALQAASSVGMVRVAVKDMSTEVVLSVLETTARQVAREIMANPERLAQLIDPNEVDAVLKKALMPVGLAGRVHSVKAAADAPRSRASRTSRASSSQSMKSRDSMSRGVSWRARAHGVFMVILSDELTTLRLETHTPWIRAASSVMPTVSKASRASVMPTVSKASRAASGVPSVPKASRAASVVPSVSKASLSRTLDALHSEGMLSSESMPQEAILTFHNYASQSPVAHAISDRVSSAASFKLDEAAVRDTAILLRMYSRSLRALHQGVDLHQVHAAFLAAVTRYLELVTFRPYPGYDTLLTGFDPAEVIEELL
jgi:hypothetical protein